MSHATATATLPIRPPALPRAGRPLLALAIALSAVAHAALLISLWTSTAAQPDAGTVMDVEIAAQPGAVAAPAASSSSAQAMARPAAVPDPERRAERAPTPARAAEAQPSIVLHVPPPARPVADPPIVADEMALPRLRAAESPPPPSATPRAVPPPPAKPRIAAAAPPQRAVPAPAERPSPGDTASAETTPGLAPGAGAAPPRYGLGSAANPAPKYPAAARERGWEGVVLLAVAVSAEGRADSVTVARSSGHGALDDAALEAVRRWRFEPARRAGLAVAGTVTVPIRFRLED